jgi:hypothetical protein
MKVYRTPYSLLFYVYLPLFALYIFLYFFEYQQLLAFRMVHWVFLGLALVLLISPQRKLRSSPPQERLPMLKWLFSLCGFVSILSGFFYCTQHFFDQAFTLNNSALLPQTMSENLLLDGSLFPWALIALFAVQLQRVYSNPHHNGLFSRCMIPIFNSIDHSNIAGYCNAYIRYTLFVSLCMLPAMIGVAGLVVFMHFSQIHLTTGLNLITTLATCSVFCVINFSRWPVYFNTLIKYRCPLVLGLLIMLISALTMLALFLYGINNLPHGANISYPLFNPAAWPLFSKIFYTFVALCWVPLASAFIAIISRGYSAGQIILTTLTVPLITTLLNFFKSSLGIASQLENPIHIAIGLITCATLLLIIFLKPLAITAAWRGRMPLGIIVKTRKPMMYTRAILITSIGVIAIIWATGVYIVPLILTSFSLSSTLLIMIATSYGTLVSRFRKTAVGIKRSVGIGSSIES